LKLPSIMPASLSNCGNRWLKPFPKFKLPLVTFRGELASHGDCRSFQ
jgi:hypothetical protein